MELQELIKKIEKILEMKRDILLVDGVYINPINISELLTLVPELEEAGFKSSVTETEYTDGKLISSKIINQKNDPLYLGSVLLDGTDIKIKDELVEVEEFIAFITDSLEEPKF